MDDQKQSLSEQLAALCAELQLYFLKKLPFGASLSLVDGNGSYSATGVERASQTVSNEEGVKRVSFSSDGFSSDGSIKNNGSIKAAADLKRGRTAIEEQASQKGAAVSSRAQPSAALSSPMKKAPPLPLTAPLPMRAAPVEPQRPFTLSLEDGSIAAGSNNPLLSNNSLLDELRQLAPHLQLLPHPPSVQAECCKADGILLYLPSKMAGQEVMLLKKIAIALSHYQQKRWVVLPLLELPSPADLEDCRCFIAAADCLDHPHLKTHLLKSCVKGGKADGLVLFDRPVVVLPELWGFLKEPKDKRRLWNDLKNVIC